MILVNKLPITVGGPFTRFDPSAPNDCDKKSCIDFVMISPNLLKNIESMKIDKTGDLKMIRATYDKGKIEAKTTDHYTIVAKLVNLPIRTENNKEVPEKEVRWNLNKEGGWKKFEELTEKAGEKITKIVEEEEKVENIALKIEKIEKKNHVPEFWKSQSNKGKNDKKLTDIIKSKSSEENEKQVEEQIAERTMEIKAERLNKELNELKKIGNKNTNVFKLAERVNGPKKAGPEAIAVKDPKTGELQTKKRRYSENISGSLH